MTHAANADVQSSLWDLSKSYGFGRIRAGGQASIGIGTTHADSTVAADNLLVTDGTEVALIDQLVFQGMTNDAATNHTISLRIGQLADSNYTDLKFHLSGTANARRHERLVWNTKGTLVVPTNGFLSFVSPTYTATTTAHVSGRYRIMKASKAAELGYFNGGTLPNVASTDTLTGSGTSAACPRRSSRRWLATTSRSSASPTPATTTTPRSTTAAWASGTALPAATSTRAASRSSVATTAASRASTRTAS